MKGYQIDCYVLIATGDPAIFGNLPAHPVTIESLKAAADTGSYNGYGHSKGAESILY